MDSLQEQVNLLTGKVDSLHSLIDQINTPNLRGFIGCQAGARESSIGR